LIARDLHCTVDEAKHRMTGRQWQDYLIFLMIEAEAKNAQAPAGGGKYHATPDNPERLAAMFNMAKDAARGGASWQPPSAN